MTKTISKHLVPSSLTCSPAQVPAPEAAYTPVSSALVHVKPLYIGILPMIRKKKQLKRPSRLGVETSYAARLL
ncbi:MAG: hypothetical protein ACTIAB_04185, partial [Lacticaseibacillus paracasei]